MVSARRAAASRMEILRLRCAAQTHKRTFYESLRSCESLRSSFPLGIHRRREQSTNNVQQVHAKGLDPASWLAVPHPLSSGVFRTHSQRAAFWRVESSQSRSRLLGFIRRVPKAFLRPMATVTDAHLEQFVEQGKSAAGRAAADLIQQATSAPGLFAFGELLDLDNVKAVRGDHALNLKSQQNILPPNAGFLLSLQSRSRVASRRSLPLSLPRALPLLSVSLFSFPHITHLPISSLS